MKYLIIFFFFFALASCQDKGLSEKDKAQLEFTIDIHNMRLRHQYSRDSLAGIDFDKIIPVRYAEEEIWFDRHLTLEKYIAWCKKHSADPMKSTYLISTNPSR